MHIIATYAQQSDVFGFIMISIVYYNMLLPCAHAQQATITAYRKFRLVFVGAYLFVKLA